MRASSGRRRAGRRPRPCRPRGCRHRSEGARRCAGSNRATAPVATSRRCATRPVHGASRRRDARTPRAAPGPSGVSGCTSRSPKRRPNATWRSRSRPVLVAEEDDLPLEQRGADRAMTVVGQIVGEVDAADLGADRRGQRLDGERRAHGAMLRGPRAGCPGYRRTRAGQSWAPGSGVVLAAAVLALWAATTAHAHGETGLISIDAASPGVATPNGEPGVMNVQVRITYANDGEPASGATATATATEAGGDDDRAGHARRRGRRLVHRRRWRSRPTAPGPCTWNPPNPPLRRTRPSRSTAATTTTTRSSGASATDGMVRRPRAPSSRRPSDTGTTARDHRGDRARCWSRAGLTAWLIARSTGRGKSVGRPRVSRRRCGPSRSRRTLPTRSSGSRRRRPRGARHGTERHRGGHGREPGHRTGDRGRAGPPGLRRRGDDARSGGGRRASEPRASGRLRVQRLDVNDPDSIVLPTDLRVLVNNAGVESDNLPVEADAVGDLAHDSSRRTSSVSSRSPRRAVPTHARAAGGGVICNVTSSSILAPVPFLGAYRASKAAVGAIGESLQAEVAQFGIRVVEIMPGPIETDMLAASDRPPPAIEHATSTARRPRACGRSRQGIRDTYTPGATRPTRRIADAILDDDGPLRYGCDDMSEGDAHGLALGRVRRRLARARCSPRSASRTS